MLHNIFNVFSTKNGNKKKSKKIRNLGPPQYLGNFPKSYHFFYAFPYKDARTRSTVR